MWQICCRLFCDCTFKCKNPHACCREPRLGVWNRILVVEVLVPHCLPNVVRVFVFLNQSQKWILQEEVGVLPLYFPFLFNPLLALAQKLPCVTPALWRVHILPVGCGIHTVQHTLYHPIQSQHMGG